MCVLYVRFGYKVRPGTFWYVAKGSTVFKSPECTYIPQGME